MTEARVTALFGGPTGQRERNDDCVSTLREWLEMAESGQIVGVAMVALEFDHMTRYTIAGQVGGHSMLGALEMAKADLIDGMQP